MFAFHFSTGPSAPNRRARASDAAPSLPLLLAEVRAARDVVVARFGEEFHRPARVGHGEPVLTIPGFLTDDRAMLGMRRSLNHAGFRAKRWKLGRNTGAREDTLDRLHARVAAVAAREGRPVHLVGWSLGGLYAREYAKRDPALIASVTTLGTPFSGSMRANNVWRLYEAVAGHSVEAPPIAIDPRPRPDVPTYAIWSRNDGAIARGSARGTAAEVDRAIEVACRHIGFCCSPEAIDAVIACVVEAEGARTTTALGSI